MLKKTITYEDFDGNKITEDFYFHMSESEIAEMNMSAVGGMEEYAKRLAKSNDNKEVIKIFRDLILKSYGELSPDKKRFIKSPELTKAFSETNAYSDLYIELLNPDKAVEFFNGIIPKKLSKTVDQLEHQKKLAQVRLIDNNGVTRLDSDYDPEAEATVVK